MWLSLRQTKDPLVFLHPGGMAVLETVANAKDLRTGAGGARDPPVKPGGGGGFRNGGTPKRMFFFFSDKKSI